MGPKTDEEAFGVLSWIVVLVLFSPCLPSLGLSFSFPPFSAPVRVVKTR